MEAYKEKVISKITEELTQIMSLDSDYYSSYNFVLSNEQQFVKDKDRKPNTIYIVIKFLETTLFYGQTIAPININAVGEQNSIEACQRLLSEFTQTYNLKSETDINNASLIIKQFYTGPQVVQNFQEIFQGFRTLFYVGGTFLFGEGSNPITSITCSNFLDEDDNPYKIDFMSAQFGFDNQLDPQAYTGTHNRTKSMAKIGTLTLSLVIYLTNDDFCNKILDLTFGNDNTNYNFALNITFANGKSFAPVNFKFANISGQQNIGEFPTVSVSFTL